MVRYAQAITQLPDAPEANAVLSLVNVERCWEEAEGLGKSAEEIANQCALLCCVQRQLGYFAALHEGAVGKGSIASRAPPLPLALTWEGPGGLDEVYGMSLGYSSGSTLLHQLLRCCKQAQADRRFGMPGEDSQLKAKVSLLRSFVDISATPTDWSPGEHGLWHSVPQEDGGCILRVYLPEVAQRLADSDSSEAGVGRVLRMLAAPGADEEAITSLPEGHVLYRFEAPHGACPVSNLPTMKRREVSREHLKEVLLAQSRLRAGEDIGLDGAAAQFAALTAGGDDPRVRAFIVPSLGSYRSAQLGFGDGLRDSGAAGLEQVRRIFVLAPVWDCYIDGCGLPERRCAWYGDVPLDLVVLERLRRSRAFVELTVEQDMRERAIEVLMPLIGHCLDKSQGFTLVPVLVGGLMSNKAEQYTKLLAPYLADASNLFVVAGDVDDLAGNLNVDRGMDALDGPRRFMREVPTLLKEDDRLLTPVFDALELFLAVLAQVPQRQEFSLNRYW